MISALKKRVLHNRELWVFTPVYFFLSLTELIIKLRQNQYWMDGTLPKNHHALMAFQYTNNEQSRLLQFLVPEAFHRLFGLTIVNSYALARLLFVFLACLVFHFYLRKWFTVVESLAGVGILCISVSVASIVPDLQESAPLLMLLFVLGLWAIREEKDLLFGIFLLIGGGLTNETMLVLPAGYFFFRLQSTKPVDIFKTGLRTVLIALPAYATQGVIRYITRDRPQLGGAYHLPGNVWGLWDVLMHPINAIYHGDYINPFLIFSILWLFAVLGYGKSPRFLKSVFWIIPFFIAANMITGIISEARQMLPLAFIIIPMSLFFIQGVLIKEEIPAQPVPKVDG